MCAEDDLCPGGRTLSFSGLPGTGNVTENSPAGTVVYTFSVDLTSNLLPNISVEVGYPVIINSNPLTKAFKINPASSLLYKVVTTGDLILDYETMPHQFELQILIYDTAGAKDLQILTVQVLDVDEPPVFQGNIATQTVTVYVLENTPSGAIYTVNAADSEKATSTEINYSLTPDSLPFNISATGTIFSLKIFDYEKDPDSYVLNITASDHLGQSASRTVIVSVININDEPPYFTSKQRAFSILEESTPGSFVANITAKDPDGEGYEQGLRFSINNPQALPNFSIDPVYGTVLVAKWLDRDTYPLKEHPNISLVLRVVDSPSDGRSDIMEIVITIEDRNDNPPECDLYNYRVVISETELPGVIILDLRNSCKDIDAEPPNNLFNFTGLSGIGSNKFTQDPPGSGRLELTGTMDLENETAEEYTLNIVVQDIAPPYFAKNIYIYVRIEPVNEFAPVFSRSSYVFDVSEITPGNVNNHFTFSPSAGSNVSRLMLALPFDYEGGLDRVWDYRLLVFITDDNLLSAANRATTIIETGTVTLTIKVIPNPTTIIPTTPGVTIVTRRANVYSASAWYVPFVIVLGSLLLLGLLGYLTFLLARYIQSHCPPKPKADKKPLIQIPEKKKAKKEVVWEMTNINPVFDGEAKDPVTGKWYEYNSKSGARKWKDPSVPSKPEAKELVPQKTVPTEPANSGQRNLNRKEAGHGKLGEQNHVEPKPLEKKTETSKQKNNSKLQMPEEERTGKGSSSPIRSKSPSPSPKVYPKYENQS
ncbi:cadherin-related family member 3 [Sceloporus undulatus]|uniref:cadherin-related family member 3 n=1 Tax=Sceloporus undulatus TaxID=8520 RepID=UPI001C4CD54B|nr:cadherin-related family member 3 [Sceloporus undulatus]